MLFRSSEACSMPGTPDMSGNKNALQQAASAVTYLRRYTLTGALGIATADTDIDGRMAFNEGMNASKDEITLESEAFLQDYYNGAPDEVKPQIMAWLKVQSFSQLTEAQAKKAITAIKAKK